MEALQQAIQRALGKAEPPLRLAILGVGQELRGDDAAGVLLARGLAERMPSSDNLLIVDAGPSPESFTGKLRAFRPELVVLADAAWMDSRPGDVRWLSPTEGGGVSAFTHTLPLKVVAQFLQQELDCEVTILAIQPKTIEFGLALSAEVSQAIENLIFPL